jgi:hypothetical protein
MKMDFVRGLIVGLLLGAVLGAGIVWVAPILPARDLFGPHQVHTPTPEETFRGLTDAERTDIARRVKEARERRENGVWIAKRSQSAVTDIQTIELVLQKGADDSRPAFSEPSISIFCEAQRRELVISFGGGPVVAQPYASQPIEFLMRLDDKPAARLHGRLRGAYRSVVLSGDIAETVQLLAASTKVGVRIEKEHGGPAEEVFVVAGLRDYLPELSQTCGWPPQKPN